MICADAFAWPTHRDEEPDDRVGPRQTGRDTGRSGDQRQ